MINKKRAKLGVSALVLAGASFVTPVASAFDYSVSGFIRQEMAYKISDKQNPNNPPGNPFNGKSLPNRAVSHPGACLAVDIVLGGACTLGLLPAETTKPKLSQKSDWMVFATRLEVDVNATFTRNITGFVKLRAYYQPDVFEDYGDPNLFNVPNHGNEATYLSHSEEHYMIDLPSLFIDYTNGPLFVRMGNQQIAWGEALFFRVADAANGLDLRRHLFLDVGAEEYADERLAAPGVRASLSFADDWEIEVFAQMFQPSVLPNRGAPYNLIPYPATVHFEKGFDDVDENINVGVRLRGQLGDLGVQLFAISRHNPDPILRTISAGPAVETSGLLAGPFGPSGETVDTQPFIQDYSREFGFAYAAEWFEVTAASGVDGYQVLHGLMDDYPFLHDAISTFSLFGVTDELGNPYVQTFESAELLVDTLVTAFGAPLQAAVEAEYAAEDIFGFGFNYIFYSEPDTLLDQLVMRFEFGYTPDKKYTNTGAASDYIVEDEWIASLALEKYHRFTDEFPATFFVFQWMHKENSDLLGRHLSGLGGDANHKPGGGEDGRGWDAMVIAMLQPFPNLTWRADFAMLYDLNGGIFLQPGVQYKPNGDWTIHALVNIVDSTNNASIFQPLEYADDFTLRITYTF